MPTSTGEKVKATVFSYIGVKTNDTNNNDIIIKNMLYLPSISSSLLSLSHLKKNGFSITFSERKVVIWVYAESTVATGKLIGKFFKEELDVDEVHNTKSEIFLCSKSN